MFSKLLLVLFTAFLSTESFAQRIESIDLLPKQKTFKNHVKNPSCSKNTENLTASGGSKGRSTTTPIDGFSECTFDASASGQTLIIAATDLVEGEIGSGGNCGAELTYQGDASLYKAYVRLAGTRVSNESQLTNVSSGSQPVSLSFPCGSSTTADPDIVIEATDNAAAAISFAEAYLGLNRNIGSVNQAELYGTITYAGAASCFWDRSGVGSDSWGSFSADTDCATPTVTGNASAPGTKIPGIVFANLPPGKYQVVATGIFRKAGTADDVVRYRMTDGTNFFGYHTLYSAAAQSSDSVLIGEYTYSSAQSNITIQMQAINPTTSNTARISADSASNTEFKIQVYRFPTSSETAYRPDQLVWRVDANISGANPDLGTSDQASYVGITNSGLTLTNNSGDYVLSAQIPCSSTNSPSGTTCSAGDESVGISWTQPMAGSVKVCASFTHRIALGAGGSMLAVFQLVETPVNAQTISQEGKARVQAGNSVANTDVSNPYTKLCGEFTFSSAGQKVVRLMYEQDVTATISSNILIADGNTNLGQRDIHFTVEPLNQNGGSLVLANQIAPTVQRFTSGSGTYTTPVGVKYIRVTAVGGGGGGEGTGAGRGGGGTGGTTTFGTSLITATGGTGGNGGGGNGGSVTINSPAVTITNANGGLGQARADEVAGLNNQGGQGGASILGGNGGGAVFSSAGGAGRTNTGGGGGGAGANLDPEATGAGGGAGGGAVALISSPSSSYSYAVGAAGTAGAGAVAGGAGGSGVIIVEEYYY